MNKKFALVTGASRGIGLSISKKLIEDGYFVFGICRNPERSEYTNQNFELISADLSKIKEVEMIQNKIPNLKDISLLVNNAGFGYFAPIEEVPIQKISELVNVNFLTPMVLTKMFMRNLKENKGQIIFVGSVAGLEVSPWGNVYGAAKSGLHHFVRQIHAELRKSEVAVNLIIPEVTKTEFYDNLNFEPDEDEKSFLNPDTIAEVVVSMVQFRNRMILREVVVTPEHFKIKRKKKN
ncbi:SDR family NAD(P)-dependent oxidoreductase [Leptospira sp. 96542]|nr:SDR family NAD(P)-dependent oxidoreductase [Leptospira sp. 96542]